MHQYKGLEAAEHLGKVSGKTGLAGALSWILSCPSKRLDHWVGQGQHIPDATGCHCPNASWEHSALSSGPALRKDTHLLTLSLH